jgi:hypothetical protein
VTANAITVKKFVVRLTAEERDHLDGFIHKGKRSAQLLTKARILLKAGVSDAAVFAIPSLIAMTSAVLKPMPRISCASRYGFSVMT